MYLTQAPNDIVALDATTGEIKWLYSYSSSREARPCCGRVNRGVAILGNTLYMATIDAHLVAVNALTGELVWDKEVAKPEAGHAMTHAPLIVKDKVIVGMAGGGFGIRGFIAAYEATTGTEAWRFYTTQPSPLPHKTQCDQIIKCEERNARPSAARRRSASMRAASCRVNSVSAMPSLFSSLPSRLLIALISIPRTLAAVTTAVADGPPTQPRIP